MNFRLQLWLATLICMLLSVSTAFAADLGNFGQLNGFADARYGSRLQDDPYEQQTSLAETRLQLGLNRMGESTTLQIRADFYYDAVVDQGTVNLDEGTG